MSRLALAPSLCDRLLEGRRLLATALVPLFVVGLSLLSGCEAAGEAVLPGEDDGGDPPLGEVCYENSLGECVLATSGCDPDDITGSVIERCASCEVDGTAANVCGPARTARCFDIELAEPCQRCVTDDGEVLYDDCAARADDLGDLLCEAVSYDNDDTTTCEVCRDGNGAVVRESCRPNAATCDDVVLNGRECRECFTAEGAFAYRECERADLDPRVCEVYAGSGGRCVDCYGDSDELLSHECTLGIELDAGVGSPMESPAYCDQLQEPGGRSCERCYSSTGSLVSEVCGDDAQASPARCESLEFSGQVCLVCVDSSGQESSTQCNSTTDSCANADGCGAPPSCQNLYLDDGTLCRTCPLANTGESETRCMSGGELVCEVVESFSEDAADEFAAVCTVCTAAGVEVYEECTYDGTAPPQPVCAQTTTDDNLSCEVCTDPSSGEELYSSCQGEPPPPSDLCSEQSGVPLTTVTGSQLYLPADDAAVDAPPEAALVDCSYCAPAENAPLPDRTGTCLMQHECNSSVTGPDSSSECGPRTTVAYDPTQCSSPPWGARDDVSDLVAAMAWLLEKADIVVYSLEDEAASADFGDVCEACDCPRGDRYLFQVSPGDAELMVGFNQGFYLPAP